MTAAVGARPRTPRPPDAPASPRRGVWRRLGGILLSLVLVAVIGALAVAVVIPRATGSVALTVLTGSMRPTLEPGDLIVSRPVEPDEVRHGDIVTFQPVSDDPALITHRVVATGTADDGTPMLITRGDANGADDEPIKAEQVRGVLVYSVPKLGFLTASLGANRVEIAVWVGVGLLGFGVVVFAASAFDRRRAPGDLPGSGDAEARIEDDR